MPNEREAAKRAIEKIPAIPVMSEYTMNAVDKPSVQACVDEVKKADLNIDRTAIIEASWVTEFKLKK